MILTSWSNQAGKNGAFGVIAGGTYVIPAGGQSQGFENEFTITEPNCTSQ
jgi:hypothetical protein